MFLVVFSIDGIAFVIVFVFQFRSAVVVLVSKATSGTLGLIAVDVV
jgi:hypothetical protein